MGAGLPVKGSGERRLTRSVKKVELTILTLFVGSIHYVFGRRVGDSICRGCEPACVGCVGKVDGGSGFVIRLFFPWGAGGAGACFGAVAPFSSHSFDFHWLLSCSMVWFVRWCLFSYLLSFFMLTRPGPKNGGLVWVWLGLVGWSAGGKGSQSVCLGGWRKAWPHRTGGKDIRSVLKEAVRFSACVCAPVWLLIIPRLPTLLEIIIVSSVSNAVFLSLLLVPLIPLCVFLGGVFFG